MNTDHEFVLWAVVFVIGLHVFEEHELDFVGWARMTLGLRFMTWRSFYVANAAVALVSVACAGHRVARPRGEPHRGRRRPCAGRIPTHHPHGPDAPILAWTHHRRGPLTASLGVDLLGSRAGRRPDGPLAGPLQPRRRPPPRLCDRDGAAPRPRRRSHEGRDLDGRKPGSGARNRSRHVNNAAWRMCRPLQCSARRLFAGRCSMISTACRATVGGQMAIGCFLGSRAPRRAPRKRSTGLRCTRSWPNSFATRWVPLRRPWPNVMSAASGFGFSACRSLPRDAAPSPIVVIGVAGDAGW
jgi:hypothetical protein